MRYCLVRILGNDQPPRHAKNQTETNVQFILKHEPDFKNCDKYFVLNRMWDPAKYNAINKLITKAGYKTLTIPFEADKYLKAKDRVLYLTNQNEARNFTIKAFVADYDVLLPFDGGTCFREDGWYQFADNVGRRELSPYYIVPMCRLKTFADYKKGVPSVNELYQGKAAPTEPQICFTKNSDRLYTEGMTYGCANKVDMLWMLGVPGPWTSWHKSLQPAARKRLSKYAGTIPQYGFVCRLPSGNKRGDTSSSIRGGLRKLAKTKIVHRVNRFVKTGK